MVRKRKSILYSLAVFPVILGVGLSLVSRLVIQRANLPEAARVSVLAGFMDAFSFFFVILATILPAAIASYSIVGEKIEKSLEPLLATPTTDSELLLGKSLAAFVPSILAAYLGYTVFAVLSDAVTSGVLGLYFPNPAMAVEILAVIPLACLLSVEWSILVSSRATDVRAASQMGVLIAVPLGAIYVLTEVRLLTLDVTSLLLLALALLVVDVLLFRVARALFRREEILTKWK